MYSCGPPPIDTWLFVEKGGLAPIALSLAIGDGKRCGRCAHPRKKPKCVDKEWNRGYYMETRHTHAAMPRDPWVRALVEFRREKWNKLKCDVHIARFVVVVVVVVNRLRLIRERETCGSVA